MEHSLPDDKFDKHRLPWGPWKSLGLAAIIMASQIIVSTICLFAYMAYSTFSNSSFSVITFLNNLESNNLFVFSATAISAPVMIWLVIIFARMKKGVPLDEYLGLKRIPLKQIGMWLLGTIIYLIVSGLLLDSLGVQDSKFMKDVGKSNTITLMVFTVVVVSVVPLYEELIFRGFLYTGFLHSSQGVAGAIIIPSLIWSIIHIQYEPIFIVSIFLMGIIFGIARYVTRSIWTPIAMHSFMNLVASIAVYVS